MGRWKTITSYLTRAQPRISSKCLEQFSGLTPFLSSSGAAILWATGSTGTWPMMCISKPKRDMSWILMCKQHLKTTISWMRFQSRADQPQPTTSTRIWLGWTRGENQACPMTRDTMRIWKTYWTSCQTTTSSYQSQRGMSIMGLQGRKFKWKRFKTAIETKLWNKTNPNSSYPQIEPQNLLQPH